MTATGPSATRWYLKKAARAGLALAASGTRRMTGVRGDGVRVLTYHGFGDRPRDPFCVDPRVFEAQMSWLAESGGAVSLADLEAHLAGTVILPRGAVLVTVDDGLRSLHSRALPILLRHRIPAVAFVTAGDIASAWPGAEPTLGWAELRELAAAGIAIGSHSWTHRSLGRLGAEEIRVEAERSRDRLERELGRPVRHFAYPYGTRADYGPTAARVLRDAGYTCAFTSQHGAVRTGADRYTLPRIKVEGGEEMWMFRLLCGGGLDGWRLVDRALWRVQASGR